MTQTAAAEGLTGDIVDVVRRSEDSRPAFGVAEYRRRLDRVRAELAERGLAAALITDPANMHYLTGYDGYAFYVTQAVIVSVDRDTPAWIGRPVDYHSARLTTWMGEEHLFTYDEGLVQRPDRHPMSRVAALLRELGLAGARIGVEYDAYFLTVRAWQVLRKHAATTDFVDITNLVNWHRLVKSPDEIALMRAAGQITERAMAAAVERIRPGSRECEAAAAAVSAQYQGLDGLCGEIPSSVPFMISGERLGASHLSWVNRRYAAGDLVNVELSGCVRRYHAPLARTVSIGEPAPDVRTMAAVMQEGVHAALEAIRPGNTCADIEAAWRRVVSRHGVVKTSRLGYPIGLAYAPDWGEHTASIRAGDETVLQPGMAFHLIAGLWAEEKTPVVLSHAVVVAEDGHELLTHHHPSDPLIVV